jgi:hypothetical protein
MRMRRIVIFPYLINTRFSKEKKKLLNTKCVFWFSVQLLSATFLILRRTKRDMVINMYRSSCAVLVIIVRLQWNWNILNIFSRNPQMSSFMKICPVGAEVLHGGGRTDRHDMTKLVVAFRSFANVPIYIYAARVCEGLYILQPTIGYDGAGSMLFFHLTFKDSKWIQYLSGIFIKQR